MSFTQPVKPKQPEGYKEAVNSVKVNGQLREVALALTVAWLGVLFHDLREFGRPAIENSIAMLVAAILLFSLWRRSPQRRGVIASLMLVYTVVNLAGALTSVLPLAIWPFEPEQSLEHYLSHGIWTIAQLPLMWEMFAFYRGSRQTK